MAAPWIVDGGLWGLIAPLLPPWPARAPGLRPIEDRRCLQGVLFVLRLGGPAGRVGVRLRDDLLAAAAPLD